MVITLRNAPALLSCRTLAILHFRQAAGAKSIGDWGRRRRPRAGPRALPDRQPAVPQLSLAVARLGRPPPGGGAEPTPLPCAASAFRACSSLGPGGDPARRRWRSWPSAAYSNR